MKIVVDAMGGDYAPQEIVQGALQVLQADPELHIILSAGNGDPPIFTGKLRPGPPDDPSL